MAASIAIDGFGWTLDIGAVPLTANELLSITFPGLSKDTLDASHASSPSHHREFLAGFKDGGEVSVEMNYAQVDYLALKAVYDADVKQAFTINMADDNFSTSDPVWTFDGHITSLTGDGPADAKVPMSVTIKVTGVPVFTAGT